MVSTARFIAASMLSSPPTSLSSGRKNAALAASSTMDITPRALRMRSSPSKAKGVVAKTIEWMPRSVSRFRISMVAPPPVPPPSAVTTTASRTPSSSPSSAEIESSAASLAATTSPPAPRPESRLPPISRKFSSSWPDAASVSTARSLRSPPKARETPCAMREPAVPTPTRSMGEDAALI